jgi:hypothetical protein
MNMAYKRACTKLAAEGAVPAVWLKVKVLKISRFALNLTFWDALPPERKKTLGWKPPRITESDEYQLNRVLLREGEKMKSVGSRR